jgi:hypothetical protein
VIHSNIASLVFAIDVHVVFSNRLSLRLLSVLCAAVVSATRSTCRGYRGVRQSLKTAKVRSSVLRFATHNRQTDEVEVSAFQISDCKQTHGQKPEHKE